MKKQSLIFLVILAIAGAYYFFDLQEKKAAEDAVQQLHQQETQELLNKQQQAIDETKQQLSNTQNQLVNLAKQQKKPRAEITSDDLKPFLSSVVMVDCNNVFGSGFLLKPNDTKYILITNAHVINQGTYPGGYCQFLAFNLNGVWGQYIVYPAEAVGFNDLAGVDVAILKIYNSSDYRSDFTTLNYIIADNVRSIVDLCPNIMPLLSPIVALGYPIYAQHTAQSEVLTDGIISSYNRDSPNLPYPNYIVSAKIDSGNSGGLAFSKDQNGLCVLGIPTWVSLGNFENGGIVQNINNVTYTK